MVKFCCQAIQQRIQMDKEETSDRRQEEFTLSDISPEIQKLIRARQNSLAKHFDAAISMFDHMPPEEAEDAECRLHKLKCDLK